MPNQSSDLLTHFKLQPLDVNKVLSEFKKDIHLNSFFNNSDFLWNNSSLVKFKKDVWRYRPEIFCLDYYDEPYFFPVILCINNLGSVFEFTPANLSQELIITPRKSDIIELMSM